MPKGINGNWRATLKHMRRANKHETTRHGGFYMWVRCGNCNEADLKIYDCHEPFPFYSRSRGYAEWILRQYGWEVGWHARGYFCPACSAKMRGEWKEYTKLWWRVRGKRYQRG